MELTRTVSLDAVRDLLSPDQWRILRYAACDSCLQTVRDKCGSKNNSLPLKGRRGRDLRYSLNWIPQLSCVQRCSGHLWGWIFAEVDFKASMAAVGRVLCLLPGSVGHLSNQPQEIWTMGRWVGSHVFILLPVCVLPLSV